MMIIIMLFLTFLTLKKFPFQLDILKKMTVKCEVKNGLVDSGISRGWLREWSPRAVGVVGG